MITPTVRGVYVVEVSDLMPYRSTKHCVCVSVGKGKYLLVNTEHRDIYDDFEISQSNYAFLNGTDRFIACAKTIDRTPSKLIREVGMLTDADTHKLAGKIIQSKTIFNPDKDMIINELREALRADE